VILESGETKMIKDVQPGDMLMRYSEVYSSMVGDKVLAVTDEKRTTVSVFTWNGRITLNNGVALSCHTDSEVLGQILLTPFRLIFWILQKLDSDLLWNLYANLGSFSIALWDAHLDELVCCIGSYY
jgi:hypothetical protein